MLQVCDPGFVDNDPDSLANRMRAVFGLAPARSKDSGLPGDGLAQFVTDTDETLRRASAILVEGDFSEAGNAAAAAAAAADDDDDDGDDDDDAHGTVQVNGVAIIPGTPSIVERDGEKPGGGRIAAVALAAFSNGSVFDALSKKGSTPPGAQTESLPEVELVLGRRTGALEQRFDAERHRAATKIQAAFKGRKARQTIAEEHQAATKIQAAFKGRKARKAKMTAAAQPSSTLSSAGGTVAVGLQNEGFVQPTVTVPAVQSRGRTMTKGPARQSRSTGTSINTCQNYPTALAAPPYHATATTASSSSTTAAADNFRNKPNRPPSSRLARHKEEAARSRLTHDAWLAQKKAEQKKKHTKAAWIRAKKEKLQVASNETQAQKDAQAAEKYKGWLLATEKAAHNVQLEQARVVREREAAKRQVREETHAKAQAAYAEWEAMKQSEARKQHEAQIAANKLAEQSKEQKKAAAAEAYKKWLAEDHSVVPTWVNEKSWVHIEPEEEKFRHSKEKKQHSHPWEREDGQTKTTAYTRNRSPVRRWLP